MTMVCDVCGRPERTPQRDGYGESDEVLSLASLSVPMTWSLSCKKGVMARCGCGETDGVKLHPADLNLYSFQGDSPSFPSSSSTVVILVLVVAIVFDVVG